MRVFLTGATGYIGNHVATALLGAGHQVVGLVRSVDAAATLTGQGGDCCFGSLENLPLLVQQCEMADGVVHAAFRSGPEGPMIDGTAVAVMLAALSGSAKPFMYTSGIWSLGDTGGRVADETTPLDPLPSVSWRTGVERLVLNAARQGVRAAVIRPAVAYGSHGGILGAMIRASMTVGAAGCVGEGLNRWQFVHVEDLGDLYRRATESAPAGTVFYGAAYDAVPMAELAAAVGRASGCHGPIMHWSLEEARLYVGDAAEAFLLDQRVSSARAATVLGWNPTAPPVLEYLQQA